MIATTATTAAAGTTATTATDRSRAASPSLGQDAFLKLLTTQLQNQDPLEPLGNDQFITQMAQFSTVSGIQDLNSTLGGISGGVSAFGLPSASGLIGRSVLVDTATARPDAAGAIQGMLTLDSAASSVVVTYSDATTGELLQSQVLGAQPAGNLGFAWDQIPAEVIGSGHRIAVSASVTTDAGTQEHGTQLYAAVVGAEVDPTTGETTLQLDGYGALSMREVQSVR